MPSQGNSICMALAMRQSLLRKSSGAGMSASTEWTEVQLGMERGRIIPCILQDRQIYYTALKYFICSPALSFNLGYLRFLGLVDGRH